MCYNSSGLTFQKVYNRPRTLGSSPGVIEGGRIRSKVAMKGGTSRKRPSRGGDSHVTLSVSLGRWQARSWQSIQERRKWPGLSSLAAIPISSATTVVCPSWSMYPKALRCVIGSGLPERRQKQLRRVETGHLIEKELPNKRLHVDAAPRLR